MPLRTCTRMQRQQHNVRCWVSSVSLQHIWILSTCSCAHDWSWATLVQNQRSLPPTSNATMGTTSMKRRYVIMKVHVSGADGGGWKPFLDTGKGGSFRVACSLLRSGCDGLLHAGLGSSPGAGTAAAAAACATKLGPRINGLTSCLVCRAVEPMTGMAGWHGIPACKHASATLQHDFSTWCMGAA